MKDSQIFKAGIIFLAVKSWLPVHKDFLLSENRTRENGDKISSIKLYCIKSYKADLHLTFVQWMLVFKF